LSTRISAGVNDCPCSHPHTHMHMHSCKVTACPVPHVDTNFYSDDESIKRKKAKKRQRDQRSSPDVKPKQRKQRKIVDKRIAGQKESHKDNKESRYLVCV